MVTAVNRRNPHRLKVSVAEEMAADCPEDSPFPQPLLQRPAENRGASERTCPRFQQECSWKQQTEENSLESLA